LSIPHTQVLTYFDGIGFHKEGVRKRQTRIGEGEVGLAALERRTIEINDLRERGAGFYRAAMAEEDGFIAYYAVPLIAKAEVKGVIEIFHREKLTPDAEWMGFLNALALQAAIAIDNTTLFNDLQRSNVEMLIAYDSTLEGWAKALELRDEETEGHTRRVVDKTLEIARAMGMSEADLVHVRRGALLHDIGKMSIPDSILLKTGTLTDEEMEIMRGHTVNAFELLSPIVYLRPALDIPYCHHERWDGSGYPRGLKGEQIPLAARIFSVVDTWDALRNERRYHPGWSRDKACEHIRSLSGIQFDPAVVDVFMSMECKQHGT
jgi:putative nucleotidyltransferase with HDIG domain